MGSVHVVMLGFTCSAQPAFPGRSMKILLFIVIFPVLTACSGSSLLVANTLAQFDDYTLTANQPYGTHALNQK